MNDRADQVLSPYLHTVDAVCLRYNREQGRIDVLLVERQNEPYQGRFALPGLVVNGDQPDNSLDDAVKRLVDTKIKQSYLHMEQVGTEGNSSRDPRCWSSTTYYLVVLGENLVPQPGQKLVPLDDLLGKVRLPFDHNDICERVADRLYSKSLYSSLPLVFLEEGVTLKDAVDAYCCVLKKTVQKSSINKRLQKMLEKGILVDSEHMRPGSRRPHKVLRFSGEQKVFMFDRCLTEPE